MTMRRPEVVVAAALALSLPMLPSFLDGAISPASALIRFAVALALCWGAVAIIERVYDTYARQARQAAIRKALEEMHNRFDQSTGAEEPRRLH